tara:strand:+ start:426 stop:587 length:162 start_codon:yes stop_codon:yes gene_type:complete
MKNKIKEYGIEYLLSNNDVCYYHFEGINKKDAIKNFENETAVSKHRIINIQEV